MINARSAFVLLLLTGALCASEVVNPDRPLKGEWDFELQKVWETSAAGEELLTRVSTIRTDEEENVCLFDMRHGRFFVYSPDGEFRFAFGRRGEGGWA